MITVNQLSKCFRIYDRPLDRLHDWLMPVRRRRGREFWALQGLDFAIEEGASVGLVGVNGAGKSTLLKILTGTMDPTLGSYEVKGRVASLLELGTGFHPDFTGRQNLQMNGKLAGLTDDELAGRMDAIIEFAELGDFIDQPVRTYSSGMALRLGFALASSVDPDVLIIDEALSVGDLHFQQKCLARIKQFHERGVTVLFVSHDPGMVQRFCTEALLLDGGRLIERGKPSDVLDYYTALLAEKHRSGGGRARILKPGEHGGPQSSSAAAAGAAGGTVGLDPAGQMADEPRAAGAGETPRGGFAPPVFAPRGHRTGNFRAVLTHAYLRALDDDAPPTTLVTSGQPARLVLRWAALEPIDTLTVGIMVRDRLGQEMYGVNTAYLGAASGPHAAGEGGEVEIVCTFNLGPGLYSLTAALHTGETHTQECYDWVEQALAFQVLPDPREKFTGLVRLQPTVRQHACPPTPETLAAARQRLTATPDAR